VFEDSQYEISLWIAAKFSVRPKQWSNLGCGTGAEIFFSKTEAFFFKTFQIFSKLSTS
jgi:hypothetical protein